MPGFDPNEPRDALGRWADSIGSATQKAASSKKFPADLTEQENEIAKLIGVENYQSNEFFNSGVNLKGLTQEQADDLLFVFKDITNGGAVRIPISSVYVCGQAFNSQCADNSAAGAFYGFDWGSKEGALYINPARIDQDFVYEETPTWDEKLEKTRKTLKDLDDIDFVMSNQLSASDVETNKAYFAQLELRYKFAKEAGKPDVPTNASLQIKRDDERFRSIVYHEMGHMVLKKEFFDSHPNARPGERSAREYKEWRDHNLPIVQANSDYGSTNSDEYFAEWFGMYKVGRVQKADLPKQVKFIVDRNPL